MADLAGLVQALGETGAFTQLINNPMAQFGTNSRNYMFGQLLPDRPVEYNKYTAQGIQYRSPIANAATRYSPVQLKGSKLVGSFKVELGEHDIGSEMNGQDYDAIIKLVEQSGGTQGTLTGNVNRPGMTAEMQALQFVDRTIVRPLVERTELDKVQAVVNAQVLRVGDDGYAETVNYSNPTNHRVAAAGVWSNNAYDPMSDIVTQAELLKGKGYTINRIITSTRVRSILTLNAIMRQRVGKVVIRNSDGAVVNQSASRATQEELNALFGTDGLPPIDLYDLQYQTSTSTGYFLPRDVMVLVATTDRNESIDRGDLEPLNLDNTLGYTAIGRTTGQSGPGRVVKVRVIDNGKPPRIECEGWQTTLPVVEAPEAIAVISGIN